MAQMLSNKDIAVAVVCSYLCVSYVQSEFNPFVWELHVRMIQLFVLFISLFLRAMYNNLKDL